MSTETLPSSEVRYRAIARQWQRQNPPKDGRTIVAIGRVIFQEDACTSVECFCSRIAWTKLEGCLEGWHHVGGGLCVARTLEDEVIIDYWIDLPQEAA